MTYRLCIPTIALLNIEPLGSKVCGENSGEVSIKLGCFPPKKSQAVQVLRQPSDHQLPQCRTSMYASADLLLTPSQYEMYGCCWLQNCLTASCDAIAATIISPQHCTKHVLRRRLGCHPAAQHDRDKVSPQPKKACGNSNTAEQGADFKTTCVPSNTLNPTMLQFYYVSILPHFNPTPFQTH
jgi:hypothetical protein